MKATSIGLCLLLFLALVPAARRSSAAPLGTAFSYQGQLKDGGLPADGVYDLQFRLFDAAAGGSQVGSTVAKGDVAVAGGLFVVSLDFGAAPFAGQARFLEIGVRPGASTGAYTLLGARQELTPSPNALFAAAAATATSATTAASATTAGTATTVSAGGVNTAQLADGAVTGAKIGSGQVVKSVNGLADTVTIAGSGGATVSTAGNTITVSAAAAPSDCTAPGTIVVGIAGDTTLIGAGYTDLNTNQGEAWRATATTVGVPTARQYHTAVWTGSRMIVWGGFFLNSGGRYDPVADSWTPTSTGTGVPSTRVAHTAVWTGSRMIIWGGHDPTGARLNTGGQYDPVGDTWTSTATTAGVPGGRSFHSAVWTGSRMIIWGGYDDVNLWLNTGGQFNPATNSWTATATAGANPSGRVEHTAVWTGSRMIIWGGDGGTGRTNTGGQYDPVANSWTATSTGAGLPSERRDHTAIWTGSRMIVWGGNANSGPTNTGGQYDPSSNSWSVTSTTSAPAARLLHTAVWTGKRMIVWGGSPSGTGFNSGGLYDPAANTWTPTLETGNVPTARYDHTAVWTGARMIVWGGWDTAVTNTGAQWLTFSHFVKN